MAERSTKCPVCVLEFADLIDAGDFHAYVCPGCGWTKLTKDTRPGNRPADVCALCDTAMEGTGVWADRHLFIGKERIYGASRCEHIPVHGSCMDAWRDFIERGMDHDGCTCHPGYVKHQEQHRPWCQQDGLVPA